MSLLERTNKLAIGTVQFGLKYGISNTYGQTDLESIKEILKSAFDNGIDTIDTARDYGSSEENLGKCDVSNFKVVSKFFDASDDTSLRLCLNESLKNLRQNSLYGYIAHTSSTLFDHPELWHSLQQFKKEGLVKKIGASLYFPEEIDRLLKSKMIPDLVQFPYNILDNRFESYFPILKSNGIEVHTRSAFLQGIFFMNPEKLNSHFKPIIPLLNELKDKLKTPELMAGFLLNYCIKNPDIQKVVIGVNTPGQLNTNIKSLKEADKLPDFKIDFKVPEKILHPSYWPQN